MKLKTIFALTLSLTTIFFVSCKKDGCIDPSAKNYDPKADEDDGSCTYDKPAYHIPSIYNFKPADFSGQTTRLNMLEELSTYMKTGNTGAVLDENKMLDMYANQNNPFSNADLNNTTKNLKDKTFTTDVDLINGYIGKLATASKSTTPGTDTSAGVFTSKSGTKSYLFARDGYEYTQLIEKTIMGAVFYFQATGYYLTEDKIGSSIDNTNSDPKEGTPRQHHWDEAFGYFGAGKTFPQNIDTLRFWGKYSNSVDPLIGSNKKIMDAFIKGRAAVSNNDNETMWEQVSVIRTEWEKVSASVAIHYLNNSMNDITDPALRNHQLSEAYAFIYSLKYNPERKITIDQINEILGYFGDNLHQITVEGIKNAKSKLSSIYNLDDIKDQL